MIVKNEKTLRTPCEEVTLDQALPVAQRLIETLNEVGGVGLAAPQIGENARVCVVNVKEPVVLVNPKIIEVATPDWSHTATPGNLPVLPNLSPNEFLTVYVEGCLSFPKKSVTTLRYTNVVVKADNHDGLLQFGPDDETMQSLVHDAGLLESVAVQHEIDHLDGVLMFDRKFRQKPAESDKIGRNQRVRVLKEDGSEEEMKYKFARRLIESGEAQLQEVP